MSECRNVNNGRALDRMQLMHLINKVSFVLVDITLYLDTHPMDEDAINYFNHYSEIRGKALKEYERMYGPLTLDTAQPDKKFEWTLQPWPWEGGNC